MYFSFSRSIPVPKIYNTLVASYTYVYHFVRTYTANNKRQIIYTYIIHYMYTFAPLPVSFLSSPFKLLHFRYCAHLYRDTVILGETTIVTTVECTIDFEAITFFLFGIRYTAFTQRLYNTDLLHAIQTRYLHGHDWRCFARVVNANHCLLCIATYGT